MTKQYTAKRKQKQIDRNMKIVFESIEEDIDKYVGAALKLAHLVKG